MENESKFSKVINYKLHILGYDINIWLLLLVIVAIVFGVMHYKKGSSGFMSETSSSMNDILNNMKDTLQTPSFVKK